MARADFEHAVMSGVNLHMGQKASDGTFPHNYWVSPNGADGLGTTTGYGNGSFEAPFLTVRRGIRETRDGRGDRVLVMMGSYAETLDIGASGTGYGPSGGYAKRNLQIIGDDSVHDGLVQIIGDGTSAQPSVRVRADYSRGFVIKNMELDSNGLAQPALQITSSDTGASPAATSNNYRWLVENVAVRSDDPNCGIVLVGATLGIIRKCWIQGPTIGIGFTGSVNNFPVDVDLEDIDFRDCVTADIATVNSEGLPATIAPVPLTNIAFHRMRHWDRGGTPVTNYVNLSTGTMVNVHFFDCYWARDVADDTLMVLPANVVVIGYSAAGLETFIGA